MTQPVAQNSTVRNVLLAGILLMLAGDFLFALNDAMGWWPASPSARSF
jgi:S-adenosylmethionine uptake transporter